MANFIEAMFEGAITMALTAVLAHPTGTTEMVLRRMVSEMIHMVTEMITRGAPSPSWGGLLRQLLGHHLSLQVLVLLILTPTWRA